MAATAKASPESSTRWELVTDQLQVALFKTEPSALGDWLSDAALHTGKVGVRRVENIGTLLRSIGERLLAEGKELVDAYEKDRFFESMQSQSLRAGREIGDVASRLGNQFREFAVMARDPGKLPEAVVLVAAALVTSGGPDGNGGVPDLDLSLGIGAHRSIFTHSIISGTLVEGCLYATCTLVGLVHRNLPKEHDPLFDLIEKNREKYLRAATAGASAGIAYHLAMDASLQPAAYHDLPFSAPMEVHQTVMGINAAAEANDVNKKGYGGSRHAPSAPQDESPPAAPHEVVFVVATTGEARPVVQSARPIPHRRTEELEGRPVPDAVKRGTSRQLWFAWLHDGDGTRRAVVLVPNAQAHSDGDIELFDGHNNILVRVPRAETWPRLMLLGDEEKSLRKELAAAYRAARKAQAL